MLILSHHRARPGSRRAQSDLRHDRNSNEANADSQQPSAETAQDPQAQLQPQQRLRGVIGYHNVFKDPYDIELVDDEPPGYGSKCMSPLRKRIPVGDHESSHDQIPSYDCSVFLQGVCDYKVEKETPFDFIEDPKWSTKYAVLSGTQLLIHDVRKPNPLALAANPSLPREMPGKLVKKFTLQHAEMGLAADHKKYILVPKSALLSFLSQSATEHLMVSEPHKFDKVYQYVIRLRVETYQILMRFHSSGERNDWINHLSAAIDIAQPLETREEPKVVTLPRRRRRRAATTNLDAMRDDQMRIARENFPNLVGNAPAEDEAEPDTVHDVDDGRHPEAGAAEQDDTAGAQNDRDTPEPDLLRLRTVCPAQISAVMQDTNITPIDLRDPRVQQVVHCLTMRGPIVNFSGGETLSVIRAAGIVMERDGLSLADVSQSIAEPPSDFDPETRKWAPHIAHDAAQEGRIRRRCMPSLLHNSKRASDVLVCNGRRMRIDWQARELRAWPEMPPSYTLCVGPSRASDTTRRNDVRQAMNSPPRPVGERTRREESQTRHESRPASRSGRSLHRFGRRSTATGAAELRIDPVPPLPRVPDDATSGSSDSSFTPATGRFLARFPRMLRKITSRHGPGLRMVHGNKSYAGHTGKDRSFGGPDESEMMERLPSHTSSINGRDDAAMGTLRKIQSAVVGRSTTALEVPMGRGAGY